MSSFFFFFNDTASTVIYTLSLHDALPISHVLRKRSRYARNKFSHESLGEVLAPTRLAAGSRKLTAARLTVCRSSRSEEHTSELQSQSNLVCRLLLEKKKQTIITNDTTTTS